MADEIKKIIGFLIITILATSIYIQFHENVKFRIDEDKTTLYVKENNRWVVGGREKNKMYDGTRLLYRDKSGITLNISFDEIEQTTTITRTTPFKRGPVIVDTYFFDGKVTDKSFVPMSHEIEIFNGTGFIYHYEAYDLIYESDTWKFKHLPDIDEGITEMEFGRNVNVRWQNDNYYGKVFNLVTRKDKLWLRYRPNSNYVKYQIKLFDPTDLMSSCTYNSTTAIIECNGTLTGNYINSINASIWVHDATINGYGAAGSVGGGAGGAGQVKFNTTYGWVNITNTTLNAYGGDGGGHNVHFTCSGGTTGLTGGVGGDGEITIMFNQTSYISDVTFNAYGGKGGTGQTVVPNTPSCLCGCTGGTGGASGDGEITFHSYSNDTITINDSTLSGYGKVGGSGVGCDDTNQCYENCGNGGAGGDGQGNINGLDHVEFLESNIINIDRGAGGAKGNGGCSGGSNGAAGKSRIYYEIADFLVFDLTNLSGLTPDTNYHIFNFTATDSFKIGFFNHSDIEDTTYIHCTANRIEYGNDSTVTAPDAQFDWTNCPAYGDGNITYTEYGDFFDNTAPTNSSWNVTSGNVRTGESTIIWQTGGQINITSNLLNFTVVTDENANGSCILDHDWNYTKTIANNSNYKFLTTETVNHSYQVYDNISAGTHCLYCSFIDIWGNELSNSSSGCLSVRRWWLPNVTLNKPDNLSTIMYKDQKDNGIVFNFTASSDGNISNCSLWGNFSGTWEVNQTTYGNYSFCYQETANVSTSCGGLSTGTYGFSAGSTWFYPASNGTNCMDGNWSSYDMAANAQTSNMYINYTKPSRAVSSSFWQVKDGDGTINLTIPSTCWSQSPLQFKIVSSAIGTFHVEEYCKNSTGWHLLQNATGVGSRAFYEEAMQWNRTIRVDNNTIINFNSVILNNEGAYRWNVKCTIDGGDEDQGIERLLYINNTNPIYINFSASATSRGFCNSSTQINASFYDEDAEGLTVYFSDNCTGSWINHTATYNTSTNISTYNINYLNHGICNMSYRFIACDGVVCNNSMPLQSFNISQHTTTTTLYLNSLSADRKYELGTTVNLTGIVDACTNETIFLDIIDTGFGYNYTNDTDSGVQYNYTKNVTSTDAFNDTTTLKTFNVSLIDYYWINLQGNVEVEEAKFKIYGSNTTTGTYPTNVEIDVLNDSVIDVELPGQLIGSYLYHYNFTNNKSSENLSFPIPGAVVRYVEFTANSYLSDIAGEVEHEFDFNWTMDLSGFDIDLDTVNFDENFYNSTYINSTYSVNATNLFYYDDYSKGEIANRWNGWQNTFGSGSPTISQYTITANTSIHNSISVTGDETCAQVYNGNYDADGGSTRYWFDDTDISDYTMVKFTGYLYGRGGGCCGCMDQCSGSGVAMFGIRDSNGNHYSFGSVSAGDAGGWGSCSYTTRTDSSIWEIKNEDGYFKVYDDGVYKTQITRDTTKDYYLYGFASAQAVMDAGSGNAYAKMYKIEFSGFRGEYLGAFEWGNASLTSQKLLNATQGNITRATLTATTSNTAGGSATYWLSNDNRTTWENVQSGVMHTFISSGWQLFARINVTTTDADLPFTVNEYDVDVVSGFASNITIDIGYDGDEDYNYSGKINSSNPQTNIQIDASDASLYIHDNCEDKLTCLIPIAFKTETSGVLQVSNMNFTQNLSYIQLNDTVFENNLSGILTSLDIMIHFESDQNGTINITNLVFETKGDDNVTCIAHFEGNENYTSSSDTQIVQWRYSPFNVSYPIGITSYDVFPATVNSKGVSPAGQIIGINESDSIAIWNITTTALTDPINVYRWYNDEVDSCLTLYNCLYFNQTNCTTISNITSTIVVTNLNRTQEQKIYDFWNLTNCNASAHLYLPGNFTWRSICSECVLSW